MPVVAEHEHWTRAVIQVGDGRGFVLQIRENRFVVSAAHCLPQLPPATNFSLAEERTYRSFLGPLGGKTTISAECVFVDPIADLALLGSPDQKQIPHDAERYDAFINSATALGLGTLTLVESWDIEEADTEKAWLLSLDAKWFRCRAVGLSRGMLITRTEGGIVGGMSGSPIVSDNGYALGVLTTSVCSDRGQTWHPQPFLSRQLPHWAGA